MKVLVVDDHPTVRQMATRLLACLGYTSLEASDAAEAEDTFTKHRSEVQLVLMDLYLDGTDGGVLARRLEAARSDLRILFCPATARTRSRRASWGGRGGGSSRSLSR